MPNAGNVSRPVFFEQAERSFLDPLVSPRLLEPGVMGRADGTPSIGTVWEYRSAGGTAVPSITAGLSSPGLGEEVEARGGIDWLEFTVEGEFREEGEDHAGYVATCADLERARVAATEGVRDSPVEVMGATFLVSARGAMWGDTFFQWFAESDGIQYGLAKPSSRGSFVAKVRVSSVRLMRDGGDVCFAEALRVLDAVGVVVRSCKLYRVDVCLDLPGATVDAYCEALIKREVITRMKAKVHTHYNADGTWQGCSTGNRKGVYVNVYDKSVELEEKGGFEAEVKRHLLVDRWGGDFDHVARVEFQIRGEWIRQRWDGVVSVSEVLAKLPGVVSYLVSQYFRIVDGPVDRENNNQQRAEVSPLWLRVVNGFVSVFGEGVELVKRTRAAFKVNAEHAKRMMVAAVKRFAACLGPDVATSQRAVLSSVVNTISSEWDESVVVRDLRSVWGRWLSMGVGELVFPERPSFRWELRDNFVPF